MSLPAQAAGTAASPILIDVGTVTAGGSGYTFAAPVITITENGYYTLSGTTTTNHVVVQTGSTDVNVTLNNVSIDVSTHLGTAAFDLTGATVNLTLTGANTLKSGAIQAGLQAPAGSTLTITAASTGSLTATGGVECAAGIGGTANQDGGNITINGGTIIANGSISSVCGGGAGIGGGAGGSGGNITITGGTVTANGGDGGAGIGGGFDADGGNIVISGGTVTANGDGDAAGIGGGNNGSGGNITINGGIVIANSGNIGAGIGGGGTGAGGNITITGGTVMATGGTGSAGIGGSYLGMGMGDSIVITGGTVTATGSAGGTGIGGGFNGTGGSITITGNANVTANGGNCAGVCNANDGGGAGIGSGGTNAAAPVVAGTIVINTTGAVNAQGGNGAAPGGSGANIGEGGYNGGNGAVTTPGTSVTTYGVTVTVTPAGGGAATAVNGNPAAIPAGANQTFTFAPNAGYRLVSVTVDGTNYGAVASWTIPNITDGSHTIAVKFDLKASADAIPALNPVMLVLLGLLTLLFGGIVIGATEYGRRQR